MKMPAIFRIITMYFLIVAIGSAATNLKPAAKTGLLGVPLPEGAKLLEDKPETDKTDSRQTYALNATAQEIVEFYDTLMPTKGWEPYGKPFRPDWRAYQRGTARIGVGVDEQKGTFSLIGHK